MSDGDETKRELPPTPDGQENQPIIISDRETFPFSLPPTYLEPPVLTDEARSRFLEEWARVQSEFYASGAMPARIIHGPYPVPFVADSVALGCVFGVPPAMTEAEAFDDYFQKAVRDQMRHGRRQVLYRALSGLDEDDRRILSGSAPEPATMDQLIAVRIVRAVHPAAVCRYIPEVRLAGSSSHYFAAHHVIKDSESLGARIIGTGPTIEAAWIEAARATGGTGGTG